MKLPNLGPNAHWEVYAHDLARGMLEVRLVVNVGREQFTTSAKIHAMWLEDAGEHALESLLRDAERAAGRFIVRGSKS